MIKSVATFVDRYGDTRTVHKRHNGTLSVKNEKKTVALHLNRFVSQMIGARIKARRLAAGYSLEKLCIKAGLASSTPKSRMWEIENALRQEGVRLGTLYAIAIALDCQIADLLPSVEEVRSLGDVAEETSVMLQVRA